MEKGGGVLEQVKSRYWRGDEEMTHSCVTQAFLSRWESPSEGSAEWNRPDVESEEWSPQR